MQAVSPVICYAVLLMILVGLKTYFPSNLDQVKWFCTPGIVFLRTWLPMMFFIFLIPAPAAFATVDPLEIFSWFFQCSFGHVVAVLLNVGIMTLSLYLMRFCNGEKEEQKENQPLSRLTRPTFSISFRISLEGTRTSRSSANLSAPATDIENQQPAQTSATSTHGLKWANRLKIMPLSLSRCNHEPVSLDSPKNSIKTVCSLDSINELKEADEELPQKNRATITKAKYSPTIVKNINSTQQQPKIKPAASTSTTKETAFIPTMDNLLKFWVGVTVFFAFAMIFGWKQAPELILHMFSFAAIVSIFIGTTLHRANIVKHFPGPMRVFMQSALIFFLFASIIVIFASKRNPEDWVQSIADFRTGLPITEIGKWSPGDYLTILVNTGVVSLAFQSLDVFHANWFTIMTLLPSIFISCTLIVIQGAGLAALMQSPDAIALPMWVRTMTTPVAVNVALLTGAPQSIVAASTIFNGLIALRAVVPMLDKLQVKDPITRGTTASIAGSLLGVLALDENNETESAGIAMASFGICTIVYTLLFTIPYFITFLSSF